MCTYRYSAGLPVYPGSVQIYLTPCPHKQGVMIGSDKCSACEYLVTRNMVRQTVKCIALTIKEELWGCKECRHYDEFGGGKDPAEHVKSINGGRCKLNGRRMKSNTTCPKKR